MAGSAYSDADTSQAAGGVAAPAAAVADPRDSPDPSSSGKAAAGFGSGPVGLAIATLLWYGLTVVYSVYNTAVLQVFPFPLTVLAAELAAGVLLIVPAWVLGVIRTPNLRMSQVWVSAWVCSDLQVCTTVWVGNGGGGSPAYNSTAFFADGR